MGDRRRARGSHHLHWGVGPGAMVEARTSSPAGHSLPFALPRARDFPAALGGAYELSTARTGGWRGALAGPVAAVLQLRPDPTGHRVCPRACAPLFLAAMV